MRVSFEDSSRFAFECAPDVPREMIRARCSDERQVQEAAECALARTTLSDIGRSCPDHSHLRPPVHLHVLLLYWRWTAGGKSRELGRLRRP